MTLPKKIFLAFIFMMSAAKISHAQQLLISDDFNDNNRNPIIWGDSTNKYVVGNGNLVESNGRLNYTCATPTALDMYLWPQREITLSAAQSWSIQMDLHVGNLNRTANGTYQYGLTLFKNSFQANDYISFALEVDANGQRKIDLSKVSNRTEIDHDSWSTTYTDLSVRLDWNGTNKTIQGYFLNNGQWQAVDITSPLPSMSSYFSDADQLVLGIGGQSRNMTILNGDLFGDNFTLYSIPEPTTWSLLLLAASLAVLLKIKTTRIPTKHQPVRH